MGLAKSDITGHLHQYFWHWYWCNREIFNKSNVMFDSSMKNADPLWVSAFLPLYIFCDQSLGFIQQAWLSNESRVSRHLMQSKVHFLHFCNYHLALFTVLLFHDTREKWYLCMCAQIPLVDDGTMTMHVCVWCTNIYSWWKNDDDMCMYVWKAQISIVDDGITMMHRCVSVRHKYL